VCKSIQLSVDFVTESPPLYTAPGFR